MNNLIESTPKVFSSTSTKCGIALQYLTALADATKFKDGIKTSSFVFTPSTSKETCSAEVPLMQAIAYLLFTSFENFC